MTEKITPTSPSTLRSSTDSQQKKHNKQNEKKTPKQTEQDTTAKKRPSQGLFDEFV